MTTPVLPPLRLLVVDDDCGFRQDVTRRFQEQGLTVLPAADAEGALALAAHTPPDVALLDLHLAGMSGIELLGRLKECQPDLEVILFTAHGSIETAVAALRGGAFDYLLKPVRPADLEAHVRRAYEKVQVARRERRWVEAPHGEAARYRLVGPSRAIRAVLRLIEKVGPTDATVLVRGPSGTGKELVARALHRSSPRRERPLVVVNCPAVTETLLESELFGHEKGAFTGALQARAGLIEVAEGGTVFIDEVAEIGPGPQAKLLRVLEDGHYRRVGGTEDRHADVRVVAATNRPLEDDLRAGRFREELYYRLNVVTIALPPLRERREDIPELVEHFLTTRQIGPTRYHLAPEALDALWRYDWPGNVRELANVLERAQILARDHVITRDDLPPDLGGAGEGWPGGWGPLPLREVERRQVVAVLRRCQGNKAQAAKALGVSRRALYRLLAKYGLEGPGPEKARAGG